MFYGLQLLITFYLTCYVHAGRPKLPPWLLVVILVSFLFSRSSNEKDHLIPLWVFYILSSIIADILYYIKSSGDSQRESIVYLLL